MCQLFIGYNILFVFGILLNGQPNCMPLFHIIFNSSASLNIRLLDPQTRLIVDGPSSISTCQLLLWDHINFFFSKQVNFICLSSLLHWVRIHFMLSISSLLWHSPKPWASFYCFSFFSFPSLSQASSFSLFPLHYSLSPSLVRGWGETVLPLMLFNTTVLLALWKGGQQSGADTSFYNSLIIFLGKAGRPAMCSRICLSRGLCEICS